MTSTALFDDSQPTLNIVTLPLTWTGEDEAGLNQVTMLTLKHLALLQYQAFLHHMQALWPNDMKSLRAEVIAPGQVALSISYQDDTSDSAPHERAAARLAFSSAMKQDMTDRLFGFYVLVDTGFHRGQRSLTRADVATLMQEALDAPTQARLRAGVLSQELPATATPATPKLKF